ALAWWPETFAAWESMSNVPLLILLLGLTLGCTAWYLTLGRGPLERLMHTVSMRAAATSARHHPDDDAAAGPDRPGPYGEAGGVPDDGPTGAGAVVGAGEETGAGDDARAGAADQLPEVRASTPA